MTVPADSRWAGLLLAAGRSIRMGQPKSRLSWQGRPLLLHQIEALLGAGADPVVVVLRPADAALVAEIAVTDKVIPVINDEPEKGRLHSVRLGLAAATASAAPASGWRAILILNVDQPRSAALLRPLVEAHFTLAREITGPTHQGRHGHPVVFARELLDEILAASEQQEGLRAVVRSDPARVAWWAVDDPTVLLDLNTPDDYARTTPEAT